MNVDIWLRTTAGIRLRTSRHMNEHVPVFQKGRRW